MQSNFLKMCFILKKVTDVNVYIQHYFKIKVGKLNMKILLLGRMH